MSKSAENISYILKWTSELTESDYNAYESVYTKVYGSREHLKDYFEKKYKKNIYGDSLHIFAYMGDECVAIQAFLRNDIDGLKAFQSNDSATLELCRGKGVFSSMVKMGVEKLEGAFIYGFPNNNSLPAFRKMGWSEGLRYKYAIGTGSAVELIKDDDLKWIIESPSNLFYTKKKGKTLLLKRKTKNLYVVIGYGDENLFLSSKISRAKLPILLHWSEKGYIGNGMLPIWVGEKIVPKIYSHKMDTIITE